MSFEVHFKRLGASHATLVVVVVGGEVYGAADREPLDALRIAARRAAKESALRGSPVECSAIVERGLRDLPPRLRLRNRPETHAS